jgi:hypothetical protein
MTHLGDLVSLLGQVFHTSKLPFFFQGFLSCRMPSSVIKKSAEELNRLYAVEKFGAKTTVLRVSKTLNESNRI